MSKKTGWVVTVVETNEIAGEVVSSDVVVFQHKVWSKVVEYVRSRWGMNMPKSCKVVDVKSGKEWQVYGI